MPGVGEAWVVKNGFVGEGFQKFNEVFLISRCEMEAAYKRVFVWVVMAGSASSGVMIENGFESGDAAVVHVGSGDGNIAQRGSFEFALLVVQAGVVEFGLIGRAGGCHGVVAEVEPAVTAEAGKGLAEEEHFSMLRGFGDCGVVAIVVIAVPGGTGGDDGALKAGDCFGDVGGCERVGVGWKGFFKERFVG